MNTSPLDCLVGSIPVCILCILMLWIVIFANWRHLFADAKRSGTGWGALWIVFTLYSVFYTPPGGDNYTALETYHSYWGGINWEYLHYEEFHFKIMDYAPYGYWSWRFLLWGVIGASAFVLLCKKLSLDKHLATIACCTFALPVLFYYQRAAAGYSLLYLSIAFLVSWRERGIIKSAIMMLLCLFAALPFHDSMVFYAVIAFFSVFFPLNKKTIIIIVIGAIVLKYSLLDYVAVFLERTAEETQKTAMYYLDANEAAGSRNIAGIIGWCISTGPLYAMLLYCIWQYITVPAQFSTYEKTFLLNTLLLLIMSTLFLSTSGAMAAKFRVASFLPWTLFLAMYYKKNRHTLACRRFVYTYLVGTIVANGYLILQGKFF